MKNTVSETELIVAVYSPNQDKYREIVTAKGKPVARVFTENFGYNISPDEAKQYAILFMAAPKLLNALIFCKSVIEAGGVFEASEKIALEKADEAINLITYKPQP